MDNINTNTSRDMFKTMSLGKNITGININDNDNNKDNKNITVINSLISKNDHELKYINFSNKKNLRSIRRQQNSISNIDIKVINKHNE